MVETLNEMVERQAEAIWVLPLVAALCALDGFFPPIPSDAVVLALAAVGAAADAPDLLLLGVVAAVGAFAGDNIAYGIGRYGGLDRLRRSNRPAVARGYRWAERGLRRRGAMVIIAARYVWVGRTVVNLSAGATGFPRRRFAAYSGIAAVTWAGYTVVLGALAGAWMEDNPLLGAAVALVTAIAVGALIDRFVHSRSSLPTSGEV